MGLRKTKKEFLPSSFHFYRMPILFWESLRDSVVPAGRLRLFVVEGKFDDVSESDVDRLGKLAGSLEGPGLNSQYCDGLSREGLGCPASQSPSATSQSCASVRSVIQESRRFPPRFRLKRLEEIDLRFCGLLSRNQRAGRALELDTSQPRIQRVSRERAPRRGVPCRAREDGVSAISRPLLVRPPHRPGVCRRAEVARGPQPLR